MVEISEVIKFLEDETGTDSISENIDITKDLGIDGDDFDDLINKYSKKYNVDISACLWYFHSSEEGSWNSIGGILFSSPDKRVKHIPITPLMLYEYIKVGKWNLQYPDHKLPKKRYDIIVNQVLVISFILILLYRCSKS